jgi:chromosome segregation ATPase
VCQADVQLLKLIQMKRASPRPGHQRPSCHPLASHVSSSSSGGAGNVAALKAKLKVLLDERDLARLQASALKASRDHLAASAAAERAQMGSQQQRMQFLYDDLAGDASTLKADFDAMAGEREALKAGFDALASSNVEQKSAYDTQKAAYDKLDADSAQLKAAYDAMEGDSVELKAGYDRLATDAALHESQRARYDALQVDAMQLKQGYDNLAISNQQMADEAAGSRASYARQKASYDKLQVGARPPHGWLVPMPAAAEALPLGGPCVAPLVHVLMCTTTPSATLPYSQWLRGWMGPET